MSEIDKALQVTLIQRLCLVFRFRTHDSADDCWQTIRSAHRFDGRGIVRDFFLKSGASDWWNSASSEKGMPTRCFLLETEAERDNDDGGTREGVERGSSADSMEGIVGKKGGKAIIRGTDPPALKNW